MKDQVNKEDKNGHKIDDKGQLIYDERCLDGHCNAYRAQESESWEYDFDKLVGVAMVGNAITYQRHTDPMTIKGFIKVLLYQDRTSHRHSLIREVIQELEPDSYYMKIAGVMVKVVSVEILKERLSLLDK